MSRKDNLWGTYGYVKWSVHTSHVYRSWKNEKHSIHYKFYNHQSFILFNTTLNKLLPTNHSYLLTHLKQRDPIHISKSRTQLPMLSASSSSGSIVECLDETEAANMSLRFWHVLLDWGRLVFLASKGTKSLLGRKKIS